ncbi:uncharacterized protein BO72DRAFT_447011 [Aspergillus fijiensis CBS 313.89]|uniref:Uncharacterized protein n=1 Tax=Aspergillus fijiensis CBS 313.89 TaxID=1448319 RepID=A0A8G1W086_9EURO|nr:uncharacterized protein BO72DRAFT_447011 [Aspergillus fijiensis CBS 313.89]RAK78348.1 hypothetical protein BO72DRAFT_447011 [Aspergillus fijiensis CBS 313.89]
MYGVGRLAIFFFSFFLFACFSHTYYLDNFLFFLLFFLFLPFAHTSTTQVQFFWAW